MTDNEAGHVVTIGDVYAQVTRMSADLSELVGHIRAIDNRNIGADQVHNDHETRLRIVEARQWQIPAASIGTLVSVIGVVAALIRAFGRG